MLRGLYLLAYDNSVEGLFESYDLYIQIVTIIARRMYTQKYVCFRHRNP